jgi:hypothetical protein
MNEATTTKLLAITAVIFVTAALVTLPYQYQVANAAPMKRYQIYVTLIGVPANAEDLIVNASIMRMPGFSVVGQAEPTTVSSPSGGEVLKFAVKVPSGSNENSIFVCSNTSDFRLSDCELYSLPSKVSGPIKVDYTYPQ